MVLVNPPPATLLIITPRSTSPASLDAIQKAHPHLRILAFSVAWNGALPDDFPQDVWPSVVALLTSTYFPQPEQVPRLKYVQLTSAGANQILEQRLFKETDVAFCTANGVHGPQISEWVIATFLAHQHRFFEYREQQKQGRWDRLSGHDDAYGKTVGILGYGSIGRQIARVATAMGLTIHASTLHPRDTPSSRKDHSYSPPGIGDPDGVFPHKWFSGSDITDFLSSGLDLLVVATPLTEQTRGLLGRKEFETLREKSSFVANIARGGVIQTDELVRALEEDVIRGAAIDVTDPEPLPDGHPLWKTKNLFITPHVSGMSNAYLDRVLEITKLNLDRLDEGEELVNKFNRKTGY